jgi:hypothetical protein
VFQKELHNGIPNGTVWWVLRKRLHLKVYKLSIVQGANVETFSQHSPHSNIWNNIVKLFFKHSVWSGGESLLNWKDQTANGNGLT